MTFIVFFRFITAAKIKIENYSDSLANENIWLYFCVTSLNNPPILSEYPFPQLP
jgi:hypothetical protein